MAEISDALIKKLAQLSRIHCDEQKIAALKEDLKKIVAHIELLNELDTENVKPCNHVLEGMQNVTREDKSERKLTREEFLAIAPDKVGGLIRVPPVIKKN